MKSQKIEGLANEIIRYKYLGLTTLDVYEVAMNNVGNKLEQEI